MQNQNEPVSPEFERDALNAINAVRITATAFKAKDNVYEPSARGQRQIVTMKSHQCTVVFDRTPTLLELRMTPNEDVAPGFVPTIVAFPILSFPDSPVFTTSNHEMAADPGGYAGSFADLVGELDVNSIFMESVLGQQEYARISQITNVDTATRRERVDLAARGLDVMLGGRYTSRIRLPALGSPAHVHIRDVNDEVFSDPKDPAKETTAIYQTLAGFIRRELSDFPSTLMFMRRDDYPAIVAEPLQYAVGVTPPPERRALFDQAMAMATE